MVILYIHIKKQQFIRLIHVKQKKLCNAKKLLKKLLKLDKFSIYCEKNIKNKYFSQKNINNKTPKNNKKNPC